MGPGPVVGRVASPAPDGFSHETSQRFQPLQESLARLGQHRAACGTPPPDGSGQIETEHALGASEISPGVPVGPLHLPCGPGEGAVSGDGCQKIETAFAHHELAVKLEPDLRADLGALYV